MALNTRTELNFQELLHLARLITNQTGLKGDMAAIGWLASNGWTDLDSVQLDRIISWCRINHRSTDETLAAILDGWVQYGPAGI